MDTAGHQGGTIRQGLGCWPTVGLFWVSDLFLQRMFLISIKRRVCFLIRIGQGIFVRDFKFGCLSFFSEELISQLQDEIQLLNEDGAQLRDQVAFWDLQFYFFVLFLSFVCQYGNVK